MARRNGRITSNLLEKNETFPMAVGSEYELPRGLPNFFRALLMLTTMTFGYLDYR